MIASYARHDLKFKFVARTSRGAMLTKETYLLRLAADAYPGAPSSVGECGIFRGLSADDVPDYEAILAGVCRSINRGEPVAECVQGMSSLLFGLECAIQGADNGFGQVLFPGPFTSGGLALPINGLVWMDTVDRMYDAARLKISQGFDTVKIKIGAYDFDSEYKLVDGLRRLLGPDRLTLRLDANGSFTPDNALERLRRLAALDIHSIEQPVRQGQWDVMAGLCAQSPIDIALDEELIGVSSAEHRLDMLRTIRPQYIILKPTLCGGLSGARAWVESAESEGIGWWPTSALESNVGLDALAQWTAIMQPGVCSGLGTGNLYENNLTSPLRLEGAMLSRPGGPVVLNDLKWTTPL